MAEEPVLADCPWDMAAVAAESEVPVAAGENVYFGWGFQDIVDRRAAAYLQPDIGRCGGVTEWIKIAQMAEDHDLRLTSHLLHELSVGLIAASSGYKIEFMNFSSMPPLPRISRFGTATLWSRKVSAMGLNSQTLLKSFMPLEPALTG